MHKCVALCLSGLRIRISPGAGGRVAVLSLVSVVFCTATVVSNGPIPRPEKSYRWHDCHGE